MAVELFCSIFFSSFMRLVLLLLSIVFLVETIVAQCPTTVGTPKCADYPDGYFISDLSNCQSYYYCPNATSPPYPGKCLLPYNFDQTRQLCNYPKDHDCPSDLSDVVGDPISAAVQYHNHFRSRHGSPNVAASSSDINNYAQKWASYLAQTDQFYHSGGPYGENLYKSWGGTTDQDAIMADAINGFYNEIKFYDFNHPGFTMQTGHFTQLVWKSSIEIGVGIATVHDDKYGHRTVICISYRPPGNVGGQYEQNVLPPRVSMEFLHDSWDVSGMSEDDKPIMSMIL